MGWKYSMRSRHTEFWCEGTENDHLKDRDRNGVGVSQDRSVKVEV
jgi:hypothetical protein